MASNSMGTLVKVAAVAGAGYLAYEWWQGQSAAAPAATPSSTPTGSPASSSPNPPLTATPATAPIYTGPSLDQMYAALVAAVVAGMQDGDTSVTCPGMSGYRGFGIVGAPSITQLDQMNNTVLPALRGGHPVAVAGGIAPRSPAPSAPASCSAPLASPDVWNWYLVNRANVGVSSAPSSAQMGLAENTPIDGGTYWAAAAPLLQQTIPGLSGFRGLGVFASSFRRMRRRGFGDGDTLDLGSVLSGQMSNPAGTGPADLGATLAAQTGQPVSTVDAGIYQYGGAAPVSAVPAVPGSSISPGVLVLGAGALVLLVGVAGGRRR